MKLEKLRNWSRSGRKQLVLASLVLALGAAVYLNWQFSGVNKLPVGEQDEESSTLGAAQLVNSAYVETVSDDLHEPAVEARSPVTTLSQARLNRQNSRDAALELLEEVLESAESDSQAKQSAVDQAALIAQNIVKETNIENLLGAKGFSECVACFQEGECSVMVSGKLEQADTLIIQEIVMEQTGVTADKIKIIGTE